jgi:hypothetical protein
MIPEKVRISPLSDARLLRELAAFSQRDRTARLESKPSASIARLTG